MSYANIDVKVREASVADATACSEVLCASIRELCVDDHHGDRHVIDGWLDNKAPEDLRGWIESPDATIFVAEVERAIAGVGGISGSEVALNYVSPNFRSCGISKVMLGELERVLRDRGVRDAVLTSTRTAHEFYLKAGWLDAGEPVESLGVMGFPMKKAL